MANVAPLITKVDAIPSNGVLPQRWGIPLSHFLREKPSGWAIKGLLPERGLAFIYGNPGAGKTFFLIDLLFAMTQGGEWRGRQLREKKICLVIAEDPHGVRNRIDAYCRINELEPESLENVTIIKDNPPNLLITSDIDKLVLEIRCSGGADVIAFDTLAASIPGGNENSGEDMGSVISHCHRLISEFDCLIIFTHHTGKEQTRGMRGWSGLLGSADLTLEVTEKSKSRTAIIKKLKNHPIHEEFHFSLKSVVIGLDEDGDSITSCVVEHLDALGAPTECAPKGRYQRLIWNHLDLLGRPDEGYNRDILIKDILARLPKGNDRDRRKELLVRALDTLVNSRRLFCVEGKIFIRNPQNSTNEKSGPLGATYSTTPYKGVECGKLSGQTVALPQSNLTVEKTQN